MRFDSYHRGFLYGGAPVVQWVKQWPADLVVLGWIPAGGRHLFDCRWGFTAHSLLLSSSHRLCITEILLKRMYTQACSCGHLHYFKGSAKISGPLEPNYIANEPVLKSSHLGKR